MKNKVIISWIIFAASVVLAVIFGIILKNMEPTYEEVQARVISSETKQLKNKKNGSTYNFYEVKVEYNGETYDLKNAHSAYEYTKGKKVKAYLANGKLYANIEGVKTSSPIGIIYYIFLLGSFIMLFVASITTSKMSQSKKAMQE